MLLFIAGFTTASVLFACMAYAYYRGAKRRALLLADKINAYVSHHQKAASERVVPDVCDKVYGNR